MTSYAYIPLILAGVAAVAWGLPASHRLRPPFDVVAALAVLAGVVASLLGILLSVLPEFFHG